MVIEDDISSVYI